MGLQVWLPLNGDLNNQGLAKLPDPSQNTLTYNNNGKIGQCTVGTCAWHLTEDILNNQWTVALWFKTTGAFSSANNVLFCKNVSSSTDCQIYFSIINGTSFNVGVNGPSSSISQSYTFSLDTWYHLAATYDGTIVKLYINGIFQKQATVTTAQATGKLNMRINGRSTNSENTSLTGNLSTYNFNDFRLYDHALSDKEVEEISKGLVLHYKLDDPNFSSNNLIINGFGDLGTTNWTTPTNIFTNEIPPNHPEIKASFKNNTTIEYIPIERNTTYEISLYIKASQTSSNTYPSFIPYDIDKKRINYYNTKVGFNLATMTTLTTELKAGDTQIYVADLSQWNANSGTNYNYAAIFGYKDNTGYIYPDGIYTQNTPAFGSGTNAKTNLDKTNNIITLNSTYTGITIPIGTSICAATAGGTYDYPFGGIANSSIADWTYKTTTFSSERTYLVAARYLKFYTYANGYYAGISLKNISNNPDNIIYDCSGYQNNGYQVNSNIIAESPRYIHAISLLGATVDNSSNTINGAEYLCGLISLSSLSNITVAWWGKGIAYGRGGIFETTAADISTNGANGTDYNTTAIANWDTTFRIYNGFSSVNFYSNIPKTDGIWHHHIFTFDGTNAKYYLDGQLIQSGALTGTLPAFNGFRMGLGRAGGVYRQIQQHISDLRIYVTALTENQIKELYNTSATIDNNGNIYAREVME